MEVHSGWTAGDKRSIKDDDMQVLAKTFASVQLKWRAVIGEAFDCYEMSAPGWIS